jgi:predicted nucleic acid-binding protein
VSIAHDLELATVRLAELWHGVERATGTHKGGAALPGRRFGVPADHPLYRQTAYEHARIWAELEVSGEMIGFYDLIVGAMALECGSEVAMLNKRHFGQIRELSVIEPK